MDGTLADTERDGHRVAFNQAFADAGLDWHWDVATYGRLLKVTGGKERIRYFIDSFEPALDAGVELDDFISALHQSKTCHFIALLQSGVIPLRPGVERLLNEARAARLRLAIATTTTPENGLLSATRAGLKTIATVNDYTCNQDFSAAAIVLDQLDNSDFQLKTVVSIFTRQNEISDAVKESF